MKLALGGFQNNRSGALPSEELIPPVDTKIPKQFGVYMRENPYLCTGRNDVRLQVNTSIRMEKSTLDTIRQYLATQPIKKAWLFGSCSRGEERADSDIDILVEYNDSDSISLMTISRIITSLSKKLNRKIDIVEDGCLMPFAEMSVEKDKQLIYERKD